MANINLLPWRADRRKLREREFYMMLLATAVAAFAVLLAAIIWMNYVITDQQDRNTYLQGEIKSLDKKIEEIKELDKTRSQLLTRKEIIEQLQSNRSQMVHLFDEMVKTIPDGTRLTSMKQAGDVLTLEGVAESNSRVATYMRNIEASPWMGHADLRKIENKAGAKDIDKKMPYVFSLDVKLRKPEAAQEADQEDAGTADNPGASTAGTAASTPPASIGAKKNAAAPQSTDKKVAPTSGTMSSTAKPAVTSAGVKK